METTKNPPANNSAETKTEKKDSGKIPPKTDNHLEKLWDYYRSANTHIC